MGYSCAARAALTLEGLYSQTCRYSLLEGKEGKILIERGREQKDGAITGKVLVLGALYEKNGVKQRPILKEASFRIDPDGQIVRMPYVPNHVKQRAEQYGEAEFNRLFGSIEKKGG